MSKYSTLISKIKNDYDNENYNEVLKNCNVISNDYSESLSNKNIDSDLKKAFIDSNRFSICANIKQTVVGNEYNELILLSFKALCTAMSTKEEYNDICTEILEVLSNHYLELLSKNTPLITTMENYDKYYVTLYIKGYLHLRTEMLKITISSAMQGNIFTDKDWDEVNPSHNILKSTISDMLHNQGMSMRQQLISKGPDHRYCVTGKSDASIILSEFFVVKSLFDGACLLAQGQKLKKTNTILKDTVNFYVEYSLSTYETPTYLIPICNGYDDRKVISDKIHKLSLEIKKSEPDYTTPSIDCYLSDKKKFSSGNNTEKTQSEGCYIATCVYGSYDCPQVWTLRRYRDHYLAKTHGGRTFIKAYYAISPSLVKWFGCTNWFKNFWKNKLDRMIAKLHTQGVESTPYKDMKW